MASQLEKGRKLGQYEIIERLGRGGMASVYRAYQPSLDREVAIKVMAERYNSDPAFVERFRREARSVARLRHPNILTVYDAGDDNGMLYIVMELIEGLTLKEVMDGKPIAFDKAESIVTQIASALDYAHNSGIIHRDVKPSNVLMDKSGRAVLSDFGIVKMIGENNNMQLTNTGTGVGTPDYMSPEQAMGEGLDVRSDQYSLGIMFYEMLTGRPPFMGDTPIAIVMGHVSKPLPLPTRYNPAVPPALEQVLLKALAKKPEDRYDTCGEFAAAIKEGLAHPYTGFSTIKFDSAINPTAPANIPASITNPEADQLYQEARQMEQQNNFQGAFAIYSRLNSQFFNYRDVPSMLERYRVMGYGNPNNPAWTRTVGTGSSVGGVTASSPGASNLSDPSIPYASVNTGSTGTGTGVMGQPPIPAPAYYNPYPSANLAASPARKRGWLVPMLAGSLVVAVIAVVAWAVLISNSQHSPASNPQSLATTATVANSSIAVTTQVAIPSTVAPVTTLAAIPSTATPVTTLAAIPSTVAPATPQADTSIATSQSATADSTTDTTAAVPTTDNPTSAATAPNPTTSIVALTYKLYKPPTNKYSVEMPQGWYITNTNDGTQDVDIFAPTSKSTDQIGINNINVPAGTDSASIDSFMADVLGTLGFNVTKTQDTTVDGAKGKLSTATFDDGKQNLNCQIATFIKNDHLWLIYYQVLPANEANFVKIFNHALQTFKAN